MNLYLYTHFTTEMLWQTAIFLHWEKFTYLPIKSVGNTEKEPNKKYKLAE